MSAWVKIEDGKKYDWTAPYGRAMRTFPAGDHLMTDEQADEVEAKGLGSRIKRPEKAKTTKAGQTDGA